MDVATDVVEIGVIIALLAMGLVIMETTLAAVLTAVEVGLMLRSPSLTPMLKSVADEPTNGPEVGRILTPAATLRLDADNEALTQIASLQPNGNDVVTVSGMPVVAVVAAVLITVVVGLPRPPPLNPMLKVVMDEPSNGLEVVRVSGPAATPRLDADNEALTQVASWQPNENDVATIFGVSVITTVATVSKIVEVGAETLPRPPPLNPMLEVVIDEPSNRPEVGRASTPAATLRLDADNEALTQTAS